VEKDRGELGTPVSNTYTAVVYVRAEALLLGKSKVTGSVGRKFE
jgi:hypothetical protein